ncbi:MAG: heat-inducible transcriptional repressor HrcA [Magnetovibrio sp.]|nr:heat-inducible transcriptional repressor HrcA [Magnetovibrio sp.]|tara:strand:- start:949 stop:1989 length:1041 start_codon:yes stop_codon:yes gene_type:complete
MIPELNARSREIFKNIVDAYVATGEPIGSRTLSKRLKSSLSPATVRNVMSDLEDAGLLFSPHASAGRLPTEAGLKLFVNGLLQTGCLTKEDRQSIEGQCQAEGTSFEGLLKEATSVLSGLSNCACLVMAPKTDVPLKHIELISLNPNRALVVLVTENGIVENRIIDIPADLPPSALVEASNFLSARMVGKTLSEAHDQIITELDQHRAQLDYLTRSVIKSGLASWADGDEGGTLIVSGQANLIDDVRAAIDLEQIRSLFEALETKDTMLKLLTLTDVAEGVQVFIGSDNKLFGMSGCSMIFGSFHNSREQLIGAIGVIGPKRMNYSRIVPMVDYTAKLVGRLVSSH